MTVIHGTCVCYEGSGILLCGESGVGKSDLALRLMSLGAQLVADDCVSIIKRAGDLWASPLPQGRGLFELRGWGVIEHGWVEKARVNLVVQLQSKPLAAAQRLPDTRVFSMMGVDVPQCHLYGWAESAAASVLCALRHVPVDDTYHCASEATS